MTSRRVLLTLVFGSVFFVGFLAFAPASLMSYALQRLSGGALSLAQTNGSLWRGTGVALLRQKTGYLALGIYHWQLQMPSASLRVLASESTPMTVRYQPVSGGVSIDDLHLTLPASILTIAAPQLGPYQLEGSLVANGDHLTLNADGMKGQIAVDWTRASSALSQIRPLGDYRILLQGNGRNVDAKLSTLSGKLQLTATGSFDKAGQMQITGTAQAAPGSAEELSELLHHLGPEVSPGVFTLALMPQSATR